MTDRTFLVFTHVSSDASEKLLNTESSQSAKDVILNETSLIRMSYEDEKRSILAAFHVQNTRFCIENEFSAKQLSTFLSIMQATLDETISSRLQIDSALAHFKKLLLAHSVELPPFSLGVFTYDEVQVISEYASNTFFRFFEFFRYALVSHVVLKVTTEETVKSAETENINNNDIFDFSREITKAEISRASLHNDSSHDEDVPQ